MPEDNQTTTMQEIKKLIEGGAEIDPRTRDILLFSAAIETSKQLQSITASLQPLIQFYKGVIWVGVTIIGALITMALSGKIEIQIK